MTIDIQLINNWLEATWFENEIQIQCESFSGHKEHIAQLKERAQVFGTSLSEFESLIKQCQDAFIYPTDNEIEAERRVQFEIQFRFERNTLLDKVDKAINKAEDLGQDSKVLRTYRQALRDATINWVMPESIL